MLRYVLFFAMLVLGTSPSAWGQNETEIIAEVSRYMDRQNPSTPPMTVAKNVCGEIAKKFDLGEVREPIVEAVEKWITFRRLHQQRISDDLKPVFYEITDGFMGLIITSLKEPIMVDDGSCDRTKRKLNDALDDLLLYTKNYMNCMAKNSDYDKKNRPRGENYSENGHPVPPPGTRDREGDLKPPGPIIPNPIFPAPPRVSGSGERTGSAKPHPCQYYHQHLTEMKEQVRKLGKEVARACG